MLQLTFIIPIKTADIVSICCVGVEWVLVVCVGVLYLIT